MDKEKIETFLMLIRHEMLVEQFETINRDYIKQIVLRAGGKVGDIDDDLFYIKTSTS